ncbi:MAG: hypothetical protein MZU95_05740 [Desulfomicrobium escambiense]|nr:hypothetical protein [Desulfomicrobium escambiense]
MNVSVERPKVHSSPSTSSVFIEPETSPLMKCSRECWKKYLRFDLAAWLQWEGNRYGDQGQKKHGSCHEMNSERFMKPSSLPEAIALERAVTRTVSLMLPSA